MSDWMEGDPANSQTNYDTFKTKYLAASKLVPEWQAYYPSEPLEALGVALKSGDQVKIMVAYENVGKLCHDCHVRTMAPTQLKYHWGDFEMITVTDPVTNSDVPFSRFKLMMEMEFSGIGTDLGQGQPENALNHLNGFEQRFQALKETCDACHDSERKYFVDDSITGMIDNLKTKLNETTIDAGAVGELLQGIGQESCSKCHLVHVPGAYAKYGLR
jgi:hypothetical protein